MDPSHKLVPGAKSKSANVQDTANSFGLHDTLQYGPRSIAAEVQTQGGLRSRLENWEETQDNAKLTVQRNVYGLHAPMRLLMERKIVASGQPMLPGSKPSNLHLDILMGRDETIEPVDIFGGMEAGLPLDLHKGMERRHM